MIQILCDGAVQSGALYDLKVGGLLFVVIGIPVLAVIGLVILVRAIIRETKKKKPDNNNPEKDDSAGDPPV